MTVFVNHIVILIAKDVLHVLLILNLILINQDVSVLMDLLSIHLENVFQLYLLVHKEWKEHQMEIVFVKMVILKLADVDQILNAP
jgi:hypothetical protein